ncbi:unnamed protein product [Darwinula stevensoni]|uniref:Uncharacterized protein n=1 Tax=Darwinula stevensoni TaxID=69355 RepID=A0A7R8X2I8_9CRUS|nr:unnamed protein product [Darwinula stevensoni]CAG0883992.1 unnamed protein product [Darwinula stevensoni]
MCRSACSSALRNHAGCHVSNLHLHMDHDVMKAMDDTIDCHSYYSQTCCLVDQGDPCKKSAGNASYSKRIEKTVAQRKLKLQVDPLARHLYICDFHKNVIQLARTKRKHKDSDNESNEADGDRPEIDWLQLQLNTLRRYRKHYKLSAQPGLNKSQLTECIRKHFKNIPVSEKEVLTFFIYMIKTNRNKLDQKPVNGNGDSNKT